MTVLGRYHDSTRIHDTAQSQSQVPGIIEIILCWPYDYDSTEIHNRRSRLSIMHRILRVVDEVNTWHYNTSREFKINFCGIGIEL